MPVQCTCAVCGAAFFVKPSKLANGRGIYCSKVCSDLAKNKSPIATYTERLIQSDTACWGWRGMTDPWGYGYFELHPNGTRVKYKIHRIALERAMGMSIPRGMFACHTCDNRVCSKNDEPGIYVVNGIARPRFGHLWLGSHADNYADMMNKRRNRFGQHHQHAKLSDAQVVRILELLSEGLAPRVIAEQFPISYTTVYDIAKGKGWPHIPRLPASV